MDGEDYKTISVLLNTQESVEKERRMSAVPGVAGAVKREPAWFRRESMQRESVIQESSYLRSKVTLKNQSFS